MDRETLGRADGGTVTVGVRPESFDLAQDASQGGVKVLVNVVEELGADAFAYGTTKTNGKDVDVIVRVDARNTPAKGETLYVVPKAGETHVFATVSGARISD
jgi:multiple sugar transport system ATP-binding protein